MQIRTTSRYCITPGIYYEPQGGWAVILSGRSQDVGNHRELGVNLGSPLPGIHPEVTTQKKRAPSAKVFILVSFITGRPVGSIQAQPQGTHHTQGPKSPLGPFCSPPIDEQFPPPVLSLLL